MPEFDFSFPNFSVTFHPEFLQLWIQAPQCAHLQDQHSRRVQDLGYLVIPRLA